MFICDKHNLCGHAIEVCPRCYSDALTERDKAIKREKVLEEAFYEIEKYYSRHEKTHSFDTHNAIIRAKIIETIARVKAMREGKHEN